MGLLYDYSISIRCLEKINHAAQLCKIAPHENSVSPLNIVGISAASTDCMS